MKVFSSPGRKPCKGKQQRTERGNLRKMYICSTLFLCSVMFVLSACSSPLLSNPSKTGTPSTNSGTSTTPSPVVSPSPTAALPVINLQVVSCPTLPENWDKVVGTKPQVNKVQKVICGSLEGSGSLAALVDVRYYSSNNRLDYYVYDNLYGTPNRRFSMQNLLDGDAEVSPSSTIMTAEIGANDPLKGETDVFKEFQWNGNGFSQILFPGMFPDMTRYQAERDQGIVNQNAHLPVPISTWKTSFYGVADNLAQEVFHWGHVSTTTIDYHPSYGIYVAQVNNLGLGGGGYVVTMNRLDNVITNILEVTKVTPLDTNMNLGAPQTGASLRSPINVGGSGTAAGSVLGEVLIFDDTYLTIGNSGSIASPAKSGYVRFSRLISYQLNQPGEQEGAVVYFTTNQNNASVTNQALMFKVFLSA